jgi:hypothetical protein
MMKRTEVLFLGLAAALFFSVPSHAQGNHGASSAANHGPAGMGATHANNGSNGTGNSVDAGKKAPDQLLSQNTKLSDNLSKLLPTGVTAQQACNGFKNLGQCVAAIHVSHNLGLDFNALKCDMTGKADTPAAACPTNTSSKKLSLGQAIDTLQPGADSKSESETAMKQAHQDIKDSSSGS